MPTKVEVPTDNTPTLALNVDEAIKAMRVSRQTFYDEVNAGNLRTFNVGRRRLVSVSAIQDWIEAREAETKPSTNNAASSARTTHPKSKPRKRTGKSAA